MKEVLFVADIKFPFQKGEVNFPALNLNIVDQIIDNVRLLLNLSPFELPYGEDIGVNIQSYVFKTMTAINRARLSQMIKTTISINEPRMIVLSVDIHTNDNIVYADIHFRIGNTEDVASMELGKNSN